MRRRRYSLPYRHPAEKAPRSHFPGLGPSSCLCSIASPIYIHGFDSEYPSARYWLLVLVLASLLHEHFLNSYACLPTHSLPPLLHNTQYTEGRATTTTALCDRAWARWRCRASLTRSSGPASSYWCSAMSALAWQWPRRYQWPMGRVWGMRILWYVRVVCGGEGWADMCVYNWLAVLVSTTSGATSS